MNNYLMTELYEKISPDFLKKNPNEFLENLKTCYDLGINIADYINDCGKEHTWFSPIPMCLFYLVGELVNKDPKFSENDIYGYDYSINESLGIEILNYLIKCGANLKIKNYYEKTIYDEIDAERKGKLTITYRAYNESLIEFIKNYRTMCIIY